MLHDEKEGGSEVLKNLLYGIKFVPKQRTAIVLADRRGRKGGSAFCRKEERMETRKGEKIDAPWRGIGEETRGVKRAGQVCVKAVMH